VRSDKARVDQVSWLHPDEFVSAVFYSYDQHAPKLGSDLLVIDEMGSERKPDFKHALSHFINTRHARFICTTMLGREQFWERYADKDANDQFLPRGGHFIDRLNHFARAFTIKGESRRRNDGGV
jgi:hypothetical protein